MTKPYGQRTRAADRTRRGRHRRQHVAPVRITDGIPADHGIRALDIHTFMDPPSLEPVVIHRPAAGAGPPDGRVQFVQRGGKSIVETQKGAK